MDLLNNYSLGPMITKCKSEIGRLVIFACKLTHQESIIYKNKNEVCDKKQEITLRNQIISFIYT